MNHKGNWMGTILDKIWMNNDESRIWTCDLRIDVPALY